MQCICMQQDGPGLCSAACTTTLIVTEITTASLTQPHALGEQRPGYLRTGEEASCVLITLIWTLLRLAMVPG